MGEHFLLKISLHVDVNRNSQTYRWGYVGGKSCPIYNWIISSIRTIFKQQTFETRKTTQRHEGVRFYRGLLARLLPRSLAQ